MSEGLRQEFVEETRARWEARAGHAVSDDDAREAIRNSAALFELLAGWDGHPNEQHPKTDGVSVKAGEVPRR